MTANIYSYIQQPDYTWLSCINCVHVSASLIVSITVSVSLRSRRPLSKSPRPLALIHYVPCFTSVSVTVKSQSVDVDSKTRINKNMVRCGRVRPGVVRCGQVRSGAVISQTVPWMRVSSCRHAWWIDDPGRLHVPAPLTGKFPTADRPHSQLQLK